MNTPVQWIPGEPYRLAGSRLAFTNWFYVRLCAFGWVDDQGQNVMVAGGQAADEAHFVRSEGPYGIRFKVHSAERSQPLLAVERPWEAGGVQLGTILQEGGRYRAWGQTGWGDLIQRGKPYFAYYESADGLHWERPDCGIFAIDGDSANNVLGRGGGTVFIDPSAPPAERYKWISEHHFTQAEFEAYQAQFPGEVDLRSVLTHANLYLGVKGATSPDGLHWTVLPLPLALVPSDTQIVAYFDPILQRYVGYFREYMVGVQGGPAPVHQTGRWNSYGRRSIGRAETTDFRHFPQTAPILVPHPGLRPSQTFYTNCRTTIPGAPDEHLMFPAVWDHATDTTEIHFASSHDGRAWSFVSAEPVFDTAAFGQWDGGCVFASPNLIELPNGDFALVYTGYNVPHKYPRQQAVRSSAYAVWPKGRLVGLEALERGAFSTLAVAAPGRRLRANALTRRAGHIQVEAARLSGETIPGREFENSIPLMGDCRAAPVVWKEHDDLGVAVGEAVVLRFRMEAAVLYYLDFEP